MVDGHTFHSHSQPLEALLSLGLPGLILWFALPLLGAEIYRRPVSGGWRRCWWRINALSFFWFQLPICMPYQALAWTALLTLLRAAPALNEIRPGAEWAGGAVPLGRGGVRLERAGSSIRRWSMAPAGMKRERAESFESHYSLQKTWNGDIKARSGARMRASAMNYGLWTAGRVEQGLAGANEPGWYAIFLTATGDAADSPKGGPAYASSSHLMLRNTCCSESIG